ncbi:MAG: hypothetical protein ACXWF8_05835 [Methylobacter sp.]
MANYDLYIKGIRPDRMDEADEIKKKASQFLKTDIDKLDELWGGPTGFCIRRNVEAEEAKQIQATLAKAGLICLNKPAAAEFKFSLVAKEEEEDKSQTQRNFTCPYCQARIPLDAGEPDPVQCPECSGIIAKYAEFKERKEIRDRLMNSKMAAERREKQLSQQEAERERKKRLEQEVSEEIFGKKPQVDKKIVIAGGVSVLALSGLVFFLSGNSGNNAPATAAPATASAPAGQPDEVSSTVAAATGGEAGAMPEGGPVDAQSSLQDTHDKANKVLNAFGMDADKLANSGGAAPAKSGSGATATTSTAGVQTAASPATTPSSAPAAGKLALIPPSALPAEIRKSLQAENTNSLATVARDGGNNQEWDLYLSQRINKAIANNKLDDAYKDAQYMADNESYIDTMGLLLARAQQGKQEKLANDIVAAMENRINTLPSANQAEYLAQAGYYQQQATQKNDLLTRAETAWQQISTPDDQLKAAARIAAYYAKTDNLDPANKYLKQAADLLEKNSLADQQVIGRAAIARAYADAGDNATAAQWLVSADKLVPDASAKALSELMDAYAYAGQQPAILQSAAKDKQGGLQYRAVQTLLKTKATNKASAIANVIQDAAYKTLAAELIASYLPADQALASLEQAEKQLPSISQPGDQAIVASRLSRHYARTGDMQKAAKFTAEAERQLNSLPSSPAKDDVLALAIRNLAQSRQFDTADNLTVFIQAEDVKTQIRNEINRIKEITP